MAKRKQGIFGRIWFVVWRFLLFLILVLLLFRFVPPPTTAFMLQSQYPVKHTWISIDKLPTYMPLAVVASEDQRFPNHFGVDFTAISKALDQYDDGDGLRGASTITQQTAKNLFLWSGRSFIRKGLEAGLAIGLETLWGKKRILEVYLNIAEFGKGIYGVEAASQHYFGRSASKLTMNQAARLAVLLPSPRTRNPNDLTFYLRERVDWVERQMQQLGPDYLKPIIE
ncbi:MAG: monofunctional biosynthetic peptidoglycan transglycosylase [Gammaproteobacteria bacterium]|uniref:Biosynthetic peptidoglycan transglycosylase n=1 Tax=Marinomonas polaris DSM 16579 TaxID=1122206 RepID=A0A1M4WTB8_9GAMM|nr:monofunctional biosynthetic peptidoglycan transglycosylase [Marinomonas polaris]MBU1293885.1 monofunctional biosynthetic peptidoglycan transglycosylase [Gammaproteobacteria bacterium]MBU2022538.1 monofunctional biosynthetic peptidoglycan transglycosylase [Gammaproteobacteria bacterium]MBU2237910.1 monofunctional biosynthetic peptidoglycan transglycosylase [Gammaproteobacteria bacterium]MBU2321303.1 monofunctional biosynthetic peptidoglycan transglycosylase [Gammaproteobacteria bacterium]MBU